MLKGVNQRLGRIFAVRTAIYTNSGRRTGPSMCWVNEIAMFQQLLHPPRLIPR